MAEDLARQMVAAARMVERNRQYIVAHARFDWVADDDPDNPAVVCYVKDGFDDEYAGYRSCRSPTLLIPLQTLLNDGWRIEREHLNPHVSAHVPHAQSGHVPETTIYILARDAPLSAPQQS